MTDLSSFRIRAYEPILAIDATGSLMLVREEQFYSDAGFRVYMHYIVLHKDLPKKVVFHFRLKYPHAVIIQLSTEKTILADGLEARMAIGDVSFKEFINQSFSK